ARELRAWINETLNRIALDSDDMAWARELHRPKEDDQRPDVSHHLLVQVAPRVCEVGFFGVKAWLFGTEGPACIRPGEDKVALADRPVCLGTLLEELPRFEASTEQTWVELLLPRSLLCVDVDQWRVGLDFIDGIPIGVEHRLIVRSLERSSRSRAAQAL